MGSTAYELAAGMEFAAGECILEIGAERGDGSTAWLARLAAERGAEFVSVDVEPGRGTVTGRAEDVLAVWDGPSPRFTWADGHDWPYSWCYQADGSWADWVVPIAGAYEARGDQLTEQASLESHLTIARLLQRITRPGTVVVFDDTWRREHGWLGKGGTAVPYLLGTGWEVYRLADCVDEHEPERSYAALRRGE